METIWSQFSRTSRERPLPSEPTTMHDRLGGQGEVGQRHVAVAVEAQHEDAHVLEGLERVVQVGRRATGTRTAAPALVFQAEAVTPTERRSGTITPWPLKADGADDRAEVARIGDPVQCHEQRRVGDVALASSSRRVSSASSRRPGTRTAGSAAPGPGGWRRPSSGPARACRFHQRDAAFGGDLQRFLDAVVHLDADCATCRALAGMPARRASTTELRPVTISRGASLRPGGRRRCAGRPGAWRPSVRRAACCLYALWYGRSSALGVGPLPSSALRPWPPVPMVGPFLDLRPLRGDRCWPSRTTFGVG